MGKNKSFNKIVVKGKHGSSLLLRYVRLDEKKGDEEIHGDGWK